MAERLDYRVDINASKLRRQRSNTLALLFFEDPTPDDTLINPFYLSMLGWITRACAARGYDLLISFQDLSGNWHVDYEDSRKADGIILLGYGDFAEFRPRVEQLVARGTHFVQWGAPREERMGASVGSDNLAGGAQATRHLLGLGRWRIAFLGSATRAHPEFLDRYRGYLAAHRQMGLEPAPGMQVDAISTEEAGRLAARELHARSTSFDAIFAASDLIALGAMRELRKAGVRIPGEVAVVGFDDIAAAGLATPALSTMAQDPRTAAQALVDTLIAQLCDGKAEGRLLPVRLVVRKSCGAASSEADDDRGCD